MKIPDSVENIITSRLDLLQPDHQLLLKVASIFGLQFNTIDLVVILPRNDLPLHDLHIQLDKLSQSQLVILEDEIDNPIDNNNNNNTTNINHNNQNHNQKHHHNHNHNHAHNQNTNTTAMGSTGRIYRFSQEIVQQVTYNSVSFANRREWHKKIAKHYERHQPQSYLLQAHHSHRAGRFTKAAKQYAR